MNSTEEVHRSTHTMVLSEHSKDNQVKALYLTRHYALKIFKHNGPKFVLFNLNLKNEIFIT